MASKNSQNNGKPRSGFSNRISIILWICVAALVVVSIVTTVFNLNSQSSANSLIKQRDFLNVALRDSLVGMGIKPEDRVVVETRDKINDEELSWLVLNWRIRVSDKFDLPYARRRLESVITQADFTHKTSWNFEDEIIPLKVEAYLADRLSHRIFFTIEKEQNDLAKISRVSPSELMKQRWEYLTEQKLVIDQSLQRFFSELGLNGPPLFISESWDKDENSKPFAHWVINVPARTDYFAIENGVQDLSPDVEINRNIELERNRTARVYDIYLNNELTHRIFFSIYQDSRGIHSLKFSDKDAVYLTPPRAAIIIDDIGYDLQAAEKLMNLKIPVTLSILPHRPYSTEIALRAKKVKFEIMLHLPMEPLSYPQADPGPGGIFVEYSAEKKIQLTEEGIDAVPYISGVNNHMGSKAMVDLPTVQSVLSTIKSRNLYFIDSRTDPKSVGYMVAKNISIPAGERTVFIDSVDNNDVEYRREQLYKVIDRAKEQGSCIAIGHPSKETIEAIISMIDEFRQHGVEFVFVSDVVS